MNAKQFKTRFKRVAKHRGHIWYVLRNNKLKSHPAGFAGFYACECGCRSFGNGDLYLVNGKAVWLDHGLAAINGQSKEGR